MVFVRFDWFQGWEEFVRLGSFGFGVEVACTIEEVEYLMLVFRTGEFAKQRGGYNSSNSVVEGLCERDL